MGKIMIKIPAHFSIFVISPVLAIKYYKILSLNFFFFFRVVMFG